MTGREAWEQEYLPKLQMSLDRPNLDGARNLPSLGNGMCLWACTWVL